MALVTIQRSPSPPETTDTSSSYYNDSIASKSQSEDFFSSKATAVLQNHRGRRKSSVIKEGDTMQCSLKMAVSLLRKEDSLKLIVNLEKVNSKIGGYRYLCLILTNGKQDTEEFIILGVDICNNKTTIGLVLPICQDMSVALDGDGGFKTKNKDGEKLFKPTSVHALWSTVQLLNKACCIAHHHNYYIGGLSHTWIGFYISKISSNRAQIAEWNRMIDADTFVNSSLAPKSGISEFVNGTQINENIRKKDEIRENLKEIMRDEDMDNVTVTFLREKLQQNVSFNLKEYRSFIAEEILIIYGKMDNASKILPYLYLGSTYNASNLEELLTNKVTHILNVTRESENFFRERFLYRNVEVFDVDETNLINYFNDSYQFINEARDSNSACLVHCQRGISRSASVVIGYLMKEFNWGRDEALEVVKKKRDCIRPNDGFMLQLKTYEGILKAKRDFNCLISNVQRNNEQSQNRPKNKTMSFPNNLCHFYEKNITVEPFNESCTMNHSRQFHSQYERDPLHYTEFSTPNNVIADSEPSNNNNNNNNLYNTLKESSKIDIHEDLLIYKSNTTGKYPNDSICQVGDLPLQLFTEHISKISKYQKDTTVKESINNNSCTNNDRVMTDYNANDTCYKTRTNDSVKRLLRLKGDASWIKHPPETIAESVILRNEYRRSHIIDAFITDEDLLKYSRKCFSCELEADIDQQPLLPVKELLRKYSNTNLVTQQP